MGNYHIISASEAQQHVQSEDALMVCAYDSDEKFKKACLDGAISLQDFHEQEDQIAKDREIILYCS